MLAQGQCGNRGGTMQMLHNIRDISQTVMRATETVITAARQQQCHRFGVTIGREDVTEMVDRHSEWINLPLCIQLNPRTIGTEAESIPGRQHDLVSILAGNFGPIIESMTGIDPAIIAASKRIAHPVSISSRIEGPIEDFSFVAAIISVGIAKVPDVRNAETDDSVTVRNQADRNVQFICKDRNFVGFPIVIMILQDANGVSRSLVGGRREWVLERTADP